MWPVPRRLRPTLAEIIPPGEAGAACAPRPGICISDWHSIRIGIKGWAPGFLDLGLSRLLIDSFCLEAVTRAQLSAAPVRLSTAVVWSGFHSSAPWIATSSSWRKTCYCRSGSAFACVRCPAKCSMARRLPTDRQPVDPVLIVSELQIICVLLRFHAQSITNFFDMFCGA